MNTFTAAQAVADAVLYEGYLLYPYRASDAKNRVRWQFGVLMPPAWAERDRSERASLRAEIPVEGDLDRLAVRVRFLHVQRRDVHVFEGTGFRLVDALDLGDTRYQPWDEAVEQEIDCETSLAELLTGPRDIPFDVPGVCDIETLHERERPVGRLVRERTQLAGAIRLAAEQRPGPYGIVRLRIEVDNRTPWSGAERADALTSALVAAHVLVSVDGSFISLLDPPEWARPYVAECDNDGVFPVLAGEPASRDLVLASPIILYDHPQVAPESPAEMFDATEIDELLSLRTLTLTDTEKRDARGTDERVRTLLDHVENMPPEMLDRLHGTLRYLRSNTPAPRNESDAITVSGVRVQRGSWVRLRPGAHSADAQDMFLAGRTATVEQVLADVDGRVHLAVIPHGSEEAAEVQRLHGRYLYFTPEEVEPVEAGS
ncbi:hypothetical protein [Saccharopolyspora phatthalungensis]|uniref:Uncharacterized protein n=1 Tax=Saccharopolyspora phatthalungensis TaxID=664693 RepID=A0A840QBB5_9PSEU|nr:hypothetical protein [Saccharopolyspora phatthalungensis]MBB5157081.1 hypothetical protein [Saccharopolyspora phatthalungensis]